MNEPHKRRKRRSLPPVQREQISLPFESMGGLTNAERTKAIIRLSQLLMQAAGVAGKESDDER